MNRRVEYKKEKNSDYYFIPVAFLLLVIAAVGIFFSVKLTLDYINQNNPATEKSEQEQYSALLDILNKEVVATRDSDSESATEIDAFIYQENHFYISGCGSTYQYSLSIKIADSSIDDTAKAYDYLIMNSGNSYSTSEFLRLNKTTSIEFETKYNGYVYKYHIGQAGVVNRVYGLIKGSDNRIGVICNYNLDTVISNAFTLTYVDNGSNLYNIYNYILNH